jgi:hypothetical protein
MKQPYCVYWLANENSNDILVELMVLARDAEDSSSKEAGRKDSYLHRNGKFLTADHGAIKLPDLFRIDEAVARQNLFRGHGSAGARGDGSFRGS